MIKPEMVSDEVVEAFVDAFYGKDMTRKAAIAEALNAWPGMWVLHQTDEDYIPPRHDIILPLMENPDD